MGVPKFVNWLCDKYPSISQIIKESEIPVFDNLYVDMNGIIHNLTHPSGKKGHFGIPEKKMFSDICIYLEKLLKMVRPRDVFYIAVDGIAPRAKMNQQRERRFGAAKETSQGESTQQAKIKFDSNCISPGTEFMEKLQEQLELFIAKKKSEDRIWKNTEIILSGHKVPGEGEHKVMDYIRLERSKPEYNPNTRHCIFGLDADLVFLGLSTHEPEFTVMRQQFNYGKKSTGGTKYFQLLDLSVLRKCIDLDFSSRLQNNMKGASFSYDLESVIDDWILLSLFLGNDFLPALPHFKIPKVMPDLIAAYVEVLPALDGYLNEKGRLNLSRLETFLDRLKQIDSDRFGVPLSSNNLRQEQTMKAKKKLHYLANFECSNEDGAVLRDLAKEYVRALQWILYYYYTGVPSWAWFYRYHHAPYVSDFKGFGSADLDFELGAPLLPFQQLMAILPASSKDLLPAPLQFLMLDGSPILDLYRPDLKETGLPFIDVTRLVAAMEPHCEHLTEQERARNTHGTVKEYKKVNSGPSGSGIMSTSVPSQVKETFPDCTPLMKKQLKRQPLVPPEVTSQQRKSDLPLQSPEVSSLLQQLQTDGVNSPKPRGRSRSESPTSRDDSTLQSAQASTPSSYKKIRKE